MDVRLATALLAITSAGCIDTFSGSNVQFDFGNAMPAQASIGATPKAGELPANIHFTFYAFQTDAMAGRLFEIQRFEVHRIVDLSSPCFIDVGEHVPHPGLHVSQYAKVIGEDTGISDIMNPPPGKTDQQKIDAATAVQRQMNVAALSSDTGIKVVTSASTGTYPALAADCTDTSGIPPPMCTDAAANARRLAMCQAEWQATTAGRAGHDYFEGTDRVLTQPLNGTTNGFVDGMNPVNLAPVGGAQFYVDEILEGFDGYAVYWQYDDADGDGQPDYPPSVPITDRNQIGEQLLFGKPTMPTRGIIHVHMTSLSNPALTAEAAIFANLAADNVQF
ncbi:MAG: hypothetical protein JWO36_637 [Myxococcales bacterium]|nr:hypothetical protein [Myxococcales bacterium]